MVKRTAVDLPDGMTLEMAEQAAELIETWEEIHGFVP